MCRPYNRQILVWLALSGLLSACSGPNPESGWTINVDTLPNGALNVVNVPPAQSSGPTWLLEEELRIGSIDGGPDTFGQLKGLVVTEDERVVVLDALAQEVRVFDPEGQHLATYGGKGGGPGELEGAYGLMLSPEGMVWVPDHSNARMSIFEVGGGFQGSYPMQVLSYSFVWSGAMTEDGRVLKPSITLSSPRKNVLRVYGPKMTLIDSLPLPDDPEQVDPENPPGAFYWEAPGGLPRGYFGVPFYPEGQQLLDPSIFVWSTERGDTSYRITRWIPGGDTTLVLETRRPPVRIPAMERDSVIDDIREQLRELGAARQDWSKVPEVRPAVASMFLAEDGSLWVETASPDSLRRYDVHERSGRYSGTVVTSLNVLWWVRPVVRGNLFWAVVTDHLGVPYVVRARIVTATPD